jgi:cytochrome c biogenesis protein CcmG/thiol:disulfide interchange protein DsbE
MSSEADRPAIAGTAKKTGRRLLVFVPLIAFATLAAIFFGQLISGRDISQVPSVLIGKPYPSLDLPPLEGLQRDGAQVPALTDAVVEGKWSLVNVWASWCAPCREEHPALLELAKDDRFTLVGINYKDETSNALRFLGELGNPFAAVGVDPKGVAAIDWGVYGIPETYLVSPEGTIVYKQIGPFLPGDFENRLIPAMEKAQGES